MFMLSPGVYVREIDLSEIVPSVATSIAALVGAPKKGDVDNPVLCTTLEQFFAEYGYPTPGNYFHYSAIGYLAHGNALWCMRVHNGAKYGGVDIKKSPGTNGSWGTGQVAPKTAYTFPTNGLMAICAINPGVWDNKLKVTVKFSDWILNEQRHLGDGSSKTFTGILAKNPLRSGSLSITDGVETFTDPLGTGTLTGSLTGTGTINYTSGAYSVTFNTAPLNETAILANYRNDPGYKAFDITVYQTNADGLDVQVEQFTGCSRDSLLDGLGIQRYVMERVNTYSQYIYVVDNTAEAVSVEPVEQTSMLTMAGGVDGATVTDGKVTTGWDKFANPDDIDINIAINGGFTSVAVQNKIIALCESRKDTIGILDTPFTVSQKGNQVTDILNFRNVTLNANTNYSALYTAWLNIYDQWNDVTVPVPLSGFVAGQYAYNDYVRDVWFAPAGFNRGRLIASGVTRNFSQGERDQLYPAQINPIQSFKGEGIVIWGDRTLQSKQSALSFVPIRRMLMVVEKSVAKSLRYFVFEPNDPSTRLNITGMIEDYLTIVQNKRGLESYKVVCDESNNPPSVRERAELHVDVYVKPVYPAEFIQLTMIITRLGASFEETMAKGF